MMHPVVQLSKASIEKGDLEVIIRAVQPIRPRTVLEIGTWRGYSAEVWSEAFRPDILVTIEKDKEHPDGIRMNKDNHYYLFEHDSTEQTTKDEVSRLFGDKQVEFMFIDGDHHFASVKRDFELYFPLVQEGGIIALHDILLVNESTEVKFLWNDLKQRFPYVECNIGSASTGLGMIFKRDEISVAQRS